MSYQTLKVRLQETVCFIQFYRPEAGNTINECLVREFNQVLDLCTQDITVIIVEGLPDVFCLGADFQDIHAGRSGKKENSNDAEALYDLWMRLATGPYITIAHVKGKANAGGVGFVAACDIVLSDDTALFSLSELLFGLFPACVLPFLIRKIGFQKANYLTLMTKPVTVTEAQTWGLVDAHEQQSDSLLRVHLLRLRRLSKNAISSYKQYLLVLNPFLSQSRSPAIAANKDIFSDLRNLELISKYVETGQFPWES